MSVLKCKCCAEMVLAVAACSEHVKLHGTPRIGLTTEVRKGPCTQRVSKKGSDDRSIVGAFEWTPLFVRTDTDPGRVASSVRPRKAWSCPTHGCVQKRSRRSVVTNAAGCGTPPAIADAANSDDVFVPSGVRTDAAF